MLLLARNLLLHLNSWVYFLIFIDELLANAAGDYLLKGKKKFGINFESNRSRLDVLAAHTNRNQVIFTCKKESYARQVSWRTTLRFYQRDRDLESGQRKTEACEGSELLSLVI